MQEVSEKTGIWSEHSGLKTFKDNTAAYIARPLLSKAVMQEFRIKKNDTRPPSVSSILQQCILGNTAAMLSNSGKKNPYTLIS